MSQNNEPYLKPTYFLDYTNPIIENQVKILIEDIPEDKPEQKAVSLFYFVRDTIKYEIIFGAFDRKSMKSSNILKKGSGFCISKAVLLASMGRAANIPSRLHFADIRNFRTTQNVLEFMGTDLYVFHGYTEFLINGKWLKANPAFDKELCDKKGYYAVEFDGKSDELFAKVDKNGNPFVEYVKDRGAFVDVPYSDILTAWAETYKASYKKEKPRFEE